jgi:hypothetical protein
MKLITHLNLAPKYRNDGTLSLHLKFQYSQFIPMIEAHCFVLLLRFRTMDQVNLPLRLQNVYRVLGHP